MFLNGWKLLDNEEDRPMVGFATSNMIGSPNWHGGLIQYLKEHFLNNSKLIRCVDIGASYGWLTAPFAKLFDKVEAFEMRSDVFGCLEHNTKGYKNINIYNFGLSDVSGEKNFNLKKDTGTSNITEKDTNNICNVKLLDEFNFESVDLIKIDVEGHELEVIKGALNTIEKNKPVLVIEIHPHADRTSFLKRQIIFKTLKYYGYEIEDVRRHDFVFISK